MTGERVQVIASDPEHLESGTDGDASAKKEPATLTLRQLRNYLKQSTPEGSSSHGQSTSNSSVRSSTRQDRSHGSSPRNQSTNVHVTGHRIALVVVFLLCLLLFFDSVVEILVFRICGKQQPVSEASGGWLQWLGERFTSDDPPSTPPIQPQTSSTNCSPSAVDPSQIQYLSGHRFDALLAQREAATPPGFHGDFQVLCHPEGRSQSGFGYCLPIDGRKDEPFCSRADRMDLLIPLPRENATYCYASVLHMLLVDVYHELKDFGAEPLVAFGTLLGAVRNGSILAYTEDADIAHRRQSTAQMKRIRQRLWEKGYHMFHFLLWRVCVAPTHPLAGVLFADKKGLTKAYAVPYLDLYEMEKTRDGDWTVTGTLDHRRVAGVKVKPFSMVTINGLVFETFADPIDFLVEEYGDGYLVPRNRPETVEPRGFDFVGEMDAKDNNRT